MSRSGRFKLFGLGFGVGAILLAGCGQDNELGRRAVTGQVTFQGQPLEQGTIRFQPQEAQGVASGAIVRQGKFEILEEQGLPPGKYQVQLSAAGAEGSGVDPTAPPGESKVVAKELIPATFNTKSTLVVEVVPEGDCQFDFVVP